MTSLIHSRDIGRVDLADIDSGTTLSPVTPGDVLRAEFMEPLSLSAHALAREIGVPTNRVTAILHASRKITADTALRLAARFGTSAELWMNLQTAHDLDIARGKSARAA